MANPGLFHGHTVVRILQILTLISAWALLASIVSDYNSQSENTPGKVLLLFIVCILASVWSICVLITVLRARNSALWIALWDLVAMGLLIAGVVAISGIVNYDCTAIRVTSLPSRDYVAVDANGNPLPSRPSVVPNTDDDDAAEFSTGRDGTVFWSSRNRCGLLRTAWTLAIINILLFFISALLALIIWRQNESEERRVVVNGRRKRNGVLLNNNPVVVEKVYVSEPEQAAFRTRRDREESRREREERRRSRDERRRSRIEDYV